MKEVRFDVDPSGLDYLIMACHSPGDRSRSVWLQLTGSGYLEVRQGASRRVGDDMWSAPDERDWDDYRSDRVALSPGETESAFQWLVDAGFFDKTKGPGLDTNGVYFVVSSQVAFEENVRLTNGDAYRKLFAALYKAGTR